MGLLMSDTVLLDPLLDETMWLRDGLREWPSVQDVVRDADDREVADQFN